MTEQERIYLKHLLIDIQNYICDCKDCNSNYNSDFCSIFSRLLIFLPRFNATYNIQPFFYDNLNCLNTDDLLKVINKGLSKKGKVKLCKEYKKLLSYYYYTFYKIMVESNPENEEFFDQHVIEECIDDCIKNCIKNEFNLDDNLLFLATINKEFIFTLIQPEDDELNFEFILVATKTSGGIGFKFPQMYDLVDGTFKIFSNGEFVEEDINKWRTYEELSDGKIYKVYRYVSQNTLGRYTPITSPQHYKLQIKRTT